MAQDVSSPKDGEGAKDDPASSGAADRYAAALFELARDANQLDQVEKDLSSWKAAWAGHKELALALSAPFIANEEKAAAALKIADLFQMSQTARNFFGLMARNGRANMIGAAIGAFGRKLSAHRGTAHAIVSTAAPLSNEARAKLSAALNAATGAKVDLEEIVDPSLIGGLKVQIGSRQFDASIKSKLDNLKTVLKGA